jgi:hypothetical protein
VIEKDYIFVATQISTSHVNDVWWLDLVATKHMMGFRTLVDMEDEFGDGDSVTIAAKATYEVKGKGNITLRILDGKIRYVKNVWYDLGVKKNLISVPRNC